MSSCPIHHLIGKQTISPDEALDLMRLQEALKICQTCMYALSQIIREALKKPDVPMGKQ